MKRSILIFWFAALPACSSLGSHFTTALHAKMKFFCLVLFTAFAATQSRWTGNVMVVNLMQNKSLDFLHCNASGKCVCVGGGDVCEREVRVSVSE